MRFEFFNIILYRNEIEKFEEVLLKYLMLIKLNGYNITYNLKIRCMQNNNDDILYVKFNGLDIQELYVNHILSLQDILNIKNILIDNFKGTIEYNDKVCIV